VCAVEWLGNCLLGNFWKLYIFLKTCNFVRVENEMLLSIFDFEESCADKYVRTITWLTQFME
jgi:hypothetical protein